MPRGWRNGGVYKYFPVVPPEVKKMLKQSKDMSLQQSKQQIRLAWSKYFQTVHMKIPDYI